MFAELYGKIFEDEPANISAVPRVPNFGQRKCYGNGTKNWQIVVVQIPSQIHDEKQFL